MPATFTDDDFRESPSKDNFTDADFEKPSEKLTFTDADFEPSAQAESTKPSSLARAARGFARGLTTVAASIPEDIAIAATKLADVTGIRMGAPATPKESKLYQLGQSIRATIPPEKTPGTFLTDTLPQAFGTGIGFLAGGVAGRAAKIPAILTTAGLGAAATASEGYQDAIAKGATEDQAFQSFLLNAGLGTTEAVPFFRLANRLGGTFKRELVKNASRAGIEEAIQEAIQQTGSNKIAQEIYDPERPLFNEVPEGASAGGIVGFTLGALTEAIGGRRGRIPTELKRPEQPIAPQVSTREDFNAIPIRSPTPPVVGETPGSRPQVGAQIPPPIPAEEVEPNATADEVKAAKAAVDEALKVQAITAERGDQLQAELKGLVPKIRANTIAEGLAQITADVLAARQRNAPDQIPLVQVLGEANLGEVSPAAGSTPTPATTPETRDEQAARIQKEVTEAERIKAIEAQKNLPPPGDAPTELPTGWKMFSVAFNPAENRYAIKSVSAPITGVSFIDPVAKSIFFGTTHGEIYDAVRINEGRKLEADGRLNGFYTGGKFVDRTPDRTTVNLSELSAKPAVAPEVAPAAPTSLGKNVGARKATPEGTAKVEAAKQRLRDIINNPDIVGRQRVDMIANGKNLIAFLETHADTRRPFPETDTLNGDLIAFTGEDAPAGFRSFIYLEGAKAGDYGVTRTEAQKASDSARNKREYQEQQAAAKRIAEASKPAAPAPEVKASGIGDAIIGHWRSKVEPVLSDFFRAATAFGVDRLERNNIKPVGMSLSDWLVKVSAQTASWDKNRKTGVTGLEMLKQKGLWPTEGPEGEALRKAMLSAVQAIKRAPGRSDDWIRTQENSPTQRTGTPTEEVKAEAPKAETAKEPWQHTKSEWSAKIKAEYGRQGFPDLVAKQATDATHRREVETAIRDGKPVPAKVLADYPDLKRAEPAAVETVPKEVAQVSDEVRWKTGAGDMARATVQRISKLPNDSEPMADVDWFGVKRVPVSQLEIVKTSSRRIAEESRLAKASPAIPAETPTPVEPAKPALPKPVQTPSAQRQPFNPKEAKLQKKFLLGAIDQAIADAPDVPPEEIQRQWQASEPFKAKQAFDDWGKTNPYPQDKPSRYNFGYDDAELARYEEATKQFNATVAEWEARRNREFAALAEPYMREMVGGADVASALTLGTEAAFYRTLPHITIEVPGDGAFDILNYRDALKAFKERAAKFPTSAAKSPAPTSPRTEASQPPRVETKRTPESDLAAIAPIKTTDAQRYVLTFAFSDGKHLVATDGRRLVSVDRKGMGGTEKKPILLDDDGKQPTDFGTDEKGKPLPPPTPPNWNQVIPLDSALTIRLKGIDTGRLFTILKQALAILPNLDKGIARSVNLFVDDKGRLGITAENADTGEYSHGVTETSKLIGAFDGEYLLDGVTLARRLGSEKVDIYSQYDLLSPAVIKGNGWKYVLMPIRTKDTDKGAVESHPKPTPKPTVRESKGEAMGNPISEQAATQAVNERLGTTELPANIRFTNNADDPAGRVVFLKGALPQIELNLAKIGSTNQLVDILHEELIHPFEDDPEYKALFAPIRALVTEEDIQRQIADKYTPEIAQVEAVNELVRRLANRNIFQRFLDWIILKVKARFKIALNRVEVARAAARIILQEAVKNKVSQAGGERFSYGEVKRAETLRNSEVDFMRRRVLGREERDLGVTYAEQQFADVGLKVHRGNGDLLFIDEQEKHFDNQPALERLLERVKQTIARSRELPEFGNIFIQSVREMMASQRAQEKRGEAVMWTNRDTYNQLTQLSRAYFSELGQRLGMMAKNSNGQEIFDALERGFDLEDEIKFEIDQGYFGGVGGEVVRTIIDEIKRQVGEDITDDAAVATAIENILTKVAPPDPGSIVYKLAQGRLKPKHKAKLIQQLSHARVQESVQSIIELTKANGVQEPPSKTVPLTPSQKLLEMVKPTTVEKIDRSVTEAVRQAERNAGFAAWEAETGASEDDIALYQAETAKEGEGGGIGPTPEQVEKGMNTAEFSHWRVIRDNLLGYSPVTDRLIQQVIRSEFKGTDFSDPTKPKKPDGREIDLNELARQPDAEVNRVFQAYLDKVEAGMDMQKASPVTKQRILALINAEIVNQLSLSRTRVNDPFFAPKREPYAKPTPDQALREALNAGLFADPRINLPDMVTRVASKAAIQRMLSNMPGMIRAVLDTPVKNQRELANAFADELSEKLGVDPAQADAAAAVFAQAYQTKFNTARENVLKTASESLAPAQRTVLFVNGKQLFNKISDFIRAGGLDDNEFFRQFAKSKWGDKRVPTDADIAKIRALVEQEDKLRQLTPAEIAKARGDAAALEQARSDRLRVTETERHLIQRKVEAMMKEWGAPTARTPYEWLTDPVLRRNWNAARNELNSANVLLGAAKFVRQILDTATFQMWYIPHRAIANTWDGFRNQLANGQEPDRAELFKNMSNDIGQVLKIRIATIGHSLAAIQQAARGRGLPTHIEQLQSGMMMAERLNMRAEELAKKGDALSVIRSYLARLWALQTLGHRQFAAIDVLQAKSAIWQEMMSQVIAGLRARGFGNAQIKTQTDDIFGNIAADLITARNDAEAILTTPEKTPTKGEINAAAWDLLQGRLYARIKALNMPADDFESRNQAYAQTIAWNRPPQGLGGEYSKFAKGLQKYTERLFPIPPLFGNAVGTSMNRALTWVGFGLFPNMFTSTNERGERVSDPWYESDVDKLHRRTEAITGLAVQGILGSLVLLGAIVVRLGWPKDKKEREEWQAKGISPYTIEFPLGNGQSLKIPLRIGPLAPMAGGLAAASAVRTLLDKKAKEQAKLNEEAAKLGVEPGKVDPINAADILGVAGTAAWNMMAGGRTATGMLGTYSDFGNLNVGRMMSGTISPMVPLLPAYQELTRLAGVQIDPASGNFWDLIVPSPWSPQRRVNMLGDDVSSPGAVSRVIGITTLGGGITGGVAQENAAYSNLYATGSRPGTISRTKGYNFNGTLRPMSRDELAQYARLRGTNLKAALMAMGTVDGMNPADAKTAVQDAITTANQQALASMGVTVKPKTLSTPRSSRSSGRRSRSLKPYRSRYRSTRIKRFKLPTFSGGRSRRRSIYPTKRRRTLSLA